MKKKNFVIISFTLIVFILLCILFYNLGLMAVSSDKKEVESLVSFDEVVATVSNKYNQILGTGTYEITSAELYYFVDLSSGAGAYKVYPCWILKGTEVKSDGTSNIQMIINAQTGEEIIP